MEELTDQNNLIIETAKGASLLFIGTMLTYLIKFIYRIIVSKYLGPSNYGLLSLGEGILNVAMLFSTIGLQVGVIKFLAEFLGEDNPGKIKGTILSVLKITLPLSIIIAILMIIFSQYISMGIFNNVKLVPIVIIVALSLPFSNFTSIVTNIFFALKKIQYRNYLNALIRPFSLLLLSLIVIFVKGPDVYLIAAVSLCSYIFSSIAGIFLLEFRTFSVVRTKIKAVYEYQRLLLFSSPLFFSGIFTLAMGWMNTFFLGIMKTTSDVGIYNVVLPLVNTITIFISTFGNIFLPLSSELHAKKNLPEVAKLFVLVSRWICLLSFPIFIIIIIFPGDILRLLFGSAYESGAIALQIIIIAYFIKGGFGPSAKTLITFNKTKTLFYISSTAAIINFILNCFLIPKYGIVGAAISTSAALFFLDGTTFFIAKRKLHFVYPLKIYLKYFISAVIPIPMILWTVQKISINYLTLVSLIIIYCLFYLFFLIITKSFTKDDIIVVLALENKTKLNLNFIKKLLFK